MVYSSFENLEVWKQSCRLAVQIYEILKDCRDFALKDQMTRSAVEGMVQERREAVVFQEINRERSTGDRGCSMSKFPVRQMDGTHPRRNTVRSARQTWKHKEISFVLG